MVNFALGTAQIGLNYGISNIDGKPTLENSLNMLDHAVKIGIRDFDTAPAYGNAEEILGQFIKSCPEQLNITTKIPKIQISIKDKKNAIYNNLENSLNKLNISIINHYLSHDFKSFLDNIEIYKLVADNLKKENKICNFGVSTYSPEEFSFSINSDFIDTIQFPISVMDSRLINLGLLDEAKENSIYLIGRSVFTQGLIFMDPSSLSQKFNGFKKHLNTFNNIAISNEISKIQLALGFQKKIGLDQILIGSENVNQLEENYKVFNDASISNSIYNELIDSFQQIEIEFIDPRTW